MTAADAEYLEKNYPVESRPGAEQGTPASTERLYLQAVNANRYYAMVILGWSLLVVMLTILFGLTLHSTWTGYYLTRSGRGVLGCALCYLELYPPVAFVIILCVEVAWLSLFYRASFTSQMPITLGLGAVYVALAHVGVILRWHPVVRLIGYLVVFAIGAGLMWAVSS
jgi:hypothetical protein